MSYFTGPNIVSKDCVVCLDAANPRSYPGTGNVWYNVGSVQGSVTGQTYTPTWTTLGGVRCFSFDQIGAYFQNDNIFPYSFPSDRASLTISVWFFPALTELIAGDRGNIVRANNGNAFYMSWNKSSQALSNYWYGKTNEGYHESGAAMTRGTWNNIVSVWTSTGLNQFLNGIKTTATTSGTVANQTNGLQIGWEANERQLAGGIALLHIYNRNLSDDEVLQNFRAFRHRFNI